MVRQVLMSGIVTGAVIGTLWQVRQFSEKRGIIEFAEAWAFAEYQDRDCSWWQESLRCAEYHWLG
jgi:hypothetical protein